ncbi:hypothetical protein CEXT_796571 [Caerostris extrusa]|uniref:Uncharacterized protein n=1 Tax=Caerostris extrusa TaxID=172846 RepID=A0AAV4QZ59_CAEEX|nr:hypothetical protein CEXT_796571 [Caerostris extrusa]
MSKKPVASPFRAHRETVSAAALLFSFVPKLLPGQTIRPISFRIERFSEAGVARSPAACGNQNMAQGH